jgi:hypothetical protein
MTGGFIPTLAIVFISISQDRKAVSEILRNAGIDVIGATSSGEFIDGYQVKVPLLSYCWICLVILMQSCLKRS